MLDTLSSYGLNLIDMLVALFLLGAIIQGFRHGLSGELARLIAMIATVWAAVAFYEDAGFYIEQHTRLTGVHAYGVAFGLLLLGLYFVTVLLRVLLKSIMEFAFKGVLERLGGVVAALLRTAIALTALLFFLSIMPHDFIRSSIREHSFTGQLLSPVFDRMTEELHIRYPDIEIFDPGAKPADNPGSTKQSPTRLQETTY